MPPNARSLITCLSRDVAPASLAYAKVGWNSLRESAALRRKHDFETDRRDA
jgi:hypothetical protein